ncbi:hypothetical protein C8R48DRAFT_270602 [Suillus tomentosus]|nr:hypothetical protein C8R48DRAFT_270602 [Suillus tomentosus]
MPQRLQLARPSSFYKVSGASSTAALIFSVVGTHSRRLVHAQLLFYFCIWYFHWGAFGTIVGGTVIQLSNCRILGDMLQRRFGIPLC